MAVKRRISISLYIMAFIFTLIIFAFGVYVSWIINKSVAEDLKANIDAMISRLQHLQTIFLLADENAPSFCPFYATELGRLEEETERMRYKIAVLEENKGVTDENLKKEYFIFETNAYLLAKKIKEKCNSSEVLVLYFYSNTNCSICQDQGVELYHARQDLAQQGIKVKTYAFDGDLNSSIVEVFKIKYNVTAYPTLIINEKKFAGFLDEKRIIDKIKEEFQ
jgi:hypothetical protein